MTTALDACVVGIGTTEYSRDIGRSEERTALEACWDALADAGLTGKDVDAVFAVDGQHGEPWELARDLGAEELRAWSVVGPGGGAAVAPVVQAALAVSCGIADVAVAYRARNRGSKAARPWAGISVVLDDGVAYEAPYGLVSPVQQIALVARRYLEETGAPADCFARVAVAQRAHATRNPRAVFRDPITVEDVLASRPIAEPLHLLECCPETDGACAVIVTSGARAADLSQPAVRIAAVAQGVGQGHHAMTNLHADDPFDWPGAVVARQLWARSGLGPDDVDVALIYDMFAPVVLFGLEAYGFCKRGDAGAFVADGHIDGTHATLPVNTHGGNLSEGFIHGFTHVLEGVRQVRGTSTSQITGAEVALVAAAPVVPTSAMLLTAGHR